MNVPGDNVVTGVIPPGGGGSHDKSDGPRVLPSNSSLCEKTLLYQQHLEKEKGEQYSTEKPALSVTSQCLYHDGFTMYFYYFLPNDLYFLKCTIQQIIPPVAEVNLEVDSWTTTHQATTAVWASKSIFVKTHFPPSQLTK